jgi:hypothetical protein
MNDKPRQKRSRPPENIETEDTSIDLGDEPSSPTLNELEENYRLQMRQIFPTKIELPLLG